jgi:hypothetical protein
MATVYGDNYSEIIASPQGQIPVGDVSGKRRFAYDQITIAAELAVNDVILVCSPLPANARIISAGLVIPACGATGIVDFGISGGDADYFIAGADPGAGAVNAKMASEVGFLAKSSSLIQPAIICTELTASATGDVWKCYVEYILE